jgi:hypothetical protein
MLQGLLWGYSILPRVRIHSSKYDIVGSLSTGGEGYRDHVVVDALLQLRAAFLMRE